jgi:hypothetical protein
MERLFSREKSWLGLRETFDVLQPFVQWIGLREILQETPKKNTGKDI